MGSWRGKEKVISNESTSESDVDATNPPTQISHQTVGVKQRQTIILITRDNYLHDTGPIAKMKKIMALYAVFESGIN